MSLQSFFTSEKILLLESIFVLGLISFVIIRKDFTYGIYIWLLSILFFEHMRLDFTYSMWPDISVDRVILVLLCIMSIFKVLSKEWNIVFLKETEYPMFLLCLLVIISMVWTGDIISRDGRIQVGRVFLSGYVLPFFMFFLSKNAYDSYKKIEKFLKFIILIGFYFVFTAIFEHFDIDMLIFPKIILDPRLGIHHERARGIFLQAQINGAVLSFVLLASDYFFLYSNKRNLYKLCSSIMLALTPMAIFFTYTRAAWLGAFLSFIIIVYYSFKEKRKMLALILIAFSIILVLSALFYLDHDAMAYERFSNKSSTQDRLNLYLISANIFTHYPIFGIGFNRFQEHAVLYFRNVGIRHSAVFKDLDTHDTFAGILAELGIVGITLILCIYLFILSKSIKLYRYMTSSDLKHKAIVVIFWGFMIVYIINSLFIKIGHFAFVNCLFFIFAGIICGWERRYKKEEIRGNESSYSKPLPI